MMVLIWKNEVCTTIKCLLNGIKNNVAILKNMVIK